MAKVSTPPLGVSLLLRAEMQLQQLTVVTARRRPLFVDPSELDHSLYHHILPVRRFGLDPDLDPVQCASLLEPTKADHIRQQYVGRLLVLELFLVLFELRRVRLSHRLDRHHL
eukprot:8700722-Pyramimonas_sp.AAC.1